MNASPQSHVTGRIPLAVKVLYTAFTAVMVPVYLKDYGPTNFLYFCDVAVLMTLVAVWTEKSLWASRRWWGFSSCSFCGWPTF